MSYGDSMPHETARVRSNVSLGRGLSGIALAVLGSLMLGGCDKAVTATASPTTTRLVDLLKHDSIRGRVRLAKEETAPTEWRFDESPAESGTLLERALDFITDDEGRYKFSNVPPGQYTLVIVAPGKEERREGIEVPSGSYDVGL